MKRQRTTLNKELESAKEIIAMLKEIPREDRSRIEGIIIGTYLKRETATKDPPADQDAS